MIDIYKANSYDEAIEFNGEIKNPYKKFLNFFNDSEFIISEKNGYKIE